MSTTTYQVTGLDSDGCTVVSREAYTLREAVFEMKVMRGDCSYEDIVRIEVTNDLNGHIVIDWNK